MRQFKYCVLSHLIVGQRVAICNYGASYSFGTVTKIETLTNVAQNETFLAVTVACDSHFDAYKASRGVVSCSGTSRITEYYERPVLSQAQFNGKERGVSI